MRRHVKLHLPIRLRLTAVFALSMAVLLTVAGGFIYFRLSAELLRSLDAALLSEAGSVAAGIGQQGAAFEAPSAAGLRSFAQVLGPGGQVLEATSPVTGHPVVAAAALSAISKPAYLDLPVPAMGGTCRVVVVPETDGGQRTWVIAGAPLASRDGALSELLALMLVGGLVTLAAASAVGWAVAGAALRPVERMRREAAAISASDPGRRLPVPASGDEISRLGNTLNVMLSRLEAAFDRERRLVDDASHELRTPLAIMKAELDLAQSRSRTNSELLAAVRSASEEADRLASLAETLLVYSRAEGGRIPLHREETGLDELLRSACSALAPQAAAAGVEVRVDPGGVTAFVDPVRMRQAIENLLRNALAHTPGGGLVRARAVREDGSVRVTVEDTGSGFDPAFIPRAFEPFARGAAGAAGADHGAGLGLAIVRAIMQAHKGRASAENRPEGGARLTLLFPGHP